MTTAFSWGALYPSGAKYAPRARPLELGSDCGTAVSVSCGYRHTVLATADGSVFTVGDGRRGQLGRPGDRAFPQQVFGELRNEAATCVAAGSYFNAAATASGALYEWGLLFTDAAQDRIVGHEQDNGQMALVGMADNYGRNEFLRRLVMRSEAAYLANRPVHEVQFEGEGRAGDRDGAADAEADAADGCTAPPLCATEVLRMRVAREVVWQPRRVASLHGARIVRVACGYAHSVAIDAAGSLWSCGYNDRGMLGVNDRRSRSSYVRVHSPPAAPGCGAAFLFTDVACGQQHSVACTSTGHALSWGSGALGQLGLGTGQDALTPTLIAALRIPAVFTAAGAGMAVTALLRGGAPAQPTFDDDCDDAPGAHGSRSDGPSAHDAQIVGVACGSNHSVLLTRAGLVLGCGHSEYGQMGTLKAGSDLASSWGGTGSCHFYVPRVLQGLTARGRVVGVAAGGQFTLARLSDGSVVSFGWNSHGCLGQEGSRDDGSDDGYACARVAGLQGRHVTAVACGYNHAVAAVAPDGDPFAAPWGRVLESVNAHNPVAVGGSGSDGLRDAYRDPRMPALWEHDEGDDGAAGTVSSWGSRRPDEFFAASQSPSVSGSLHPTRVGSALDADTSVAAVPADVLLSGSAFAGARGFSEASALPSSVPVTASDAADQSVPFKPTRTTGGSVAVRQEINAAIVAMAKRRQARQQPQADAQIEADSTSATPSPSTAATAASSSTGAAAGARETPCESPVHCHSLLLLARCPALAAAMRAASSAAAAAEGGGGGPVTLPGGAACRGISVAFSPASGRWQLHFPGVRRVVLFGLAHYLYSDSLPRLPSHRVRQLRDLASALSLPRLVHLCQGLAHAYDREATVPGRWRFAQYVQARSSTGAGRVHGTSSPTEHEIGNPPDSTFGSDLTSLLHSEQGADVELTVECREQQGEGGTPQAARRRTFRLHALILCRYSYFRRLMKGGFSESAAAASASSSGGRPAYTLRDLDPDAFWDVLLYVYGGRLAHLQAAPDRCLAALAVAARFCIQDLVLQGQDLAASLMGAGDAEELREFAAVHGLGRLHAVCIALIAKT